MMCSLMYRGTENAKRSPDNSLTKEKHINWFYICKIRETTTWAISYRSRICLGSWACNWVNITVKSIFAIGKYIINKSEFFFKKLTLFIFICNCLHYFHSKEKLQSYMDRLRWINALFDYRATTSDWVLTIIIGRNKFHLSFTLI